MPAELWGLLGTIAGGLAVVVAGWVTARIGRSSEAMKAVASPYSELSARVVQLEQRVDRLEKERDALRDERDMLRDEVESHTRERETLRDLVTALWLYMEDHLPPGVGVPFRRPEWLTNTEPPTGGSPM